MLRKTDEPSEYIADFYDHKVDSFLRPQNAPMTRDKQMTGYDFGEKFSPQSSVVRTGDLKASNLVKLSYDVFGTVTGLSNNVSVLLTLTLTPQTTFKKSRAIGMPSVSIFQGTSIDTVGTATQIYPKTGGSVSYTDWRINAGNDWNSTDDNDIVHHIIVANESGSTNNFVVAANFRYIFNNAGKEA